MPSLQIADLTAVPRTRSTSLEDTVAAFSNRNRVNEVDRQDRDALADIYKQHQNDGENIGKMIQSIQTRDMSPSARVSAIDQLLKFQQHNMQLQKQAAVQQALQKKENEKTQQRIDQETEKQKGRAALERNNASPELVALYEVSPVGGQTKIVENVIESNQRKQTPPELKSPEIHDYDAGLTPKERVKRQDDRFRIQTPLVRENSMALSALQNEALSIDLLDELTDSGKVGEGLHKLNINPKTGDLFIPQLATAEEQLFVKTVNDFTVKAKDSFGARVTNFELDRFMQRLPTLANSAEGRKLILQQMSIINKLNQIEKQAVQDVFDQYGVRNIDYVDAENKAREKIKDQKEALRKQYMELEQVAKKDEQAQISNIKDHVKPGYVAMRKPDGTVKQFPEANVPNLEEKGYKRL